MCISVKIKKKLQTALYFFRTALLYTMKIQQAVTQTTVIISLLKKKAVIVLNYAPMDAVL